MGAFVWTLIVFIFAFMLPLLDDEISMKITPIIASVFFVLTGIVCIVKFERGKYIDGMVVCQWIEKATELVDVPNENYLLGHRYFSEKKNTLYKTEIKWDDGKTHIMAMQNCAANHIQLVPADRIRKYKSTSEFIKFLTTKKEGKRQWQNSVLNVGICLAKT